MSGGAFDYAFRDVEDFAENLDRWIEEWLVADEAMPRAVATLRAIAADARRTAALMRAAEWLASGDYGEDSFLAEVSAVRGET